MSTFRWEVVGSDSEISFQPLAWPAYTLMAYTQEILSEEAYWQGVLLSDDYERKVLTETSEEAWEVHGEEVCDLQTFGQET